MLTVNSVKNLLKTDEEHFYGLVKIETSSWLAAVGLDGRDKNK